MDKFGVKKYGRVIKYNGRYGTIQSEDTQADFENKDLVSDVKVGDLVSYREEYRTDVILARAIIVERRQNESN